MYDLSPRVSASSGFYMVLAHCGILTTLNNAGCTLHRLLSLTRFGKSDPRCYPLAVGIDDVQAGVTHVFVNLGSDHPSILEAIVKGQKERKGQFPKIMTCPNEVREENNSDIIGLLTPRR